MGKNRPNRCVGVQGHVCKEKQVGDKSSQRTLHDTGITRIHVCRAHVRD